MALPVECLAAFCLGGAPALLAMKAAPGEYACPGCDGTGYVEKGGRITSVGAQQCVVCWGHGVVFNYGCRKAKLCAWGP